MDCFILELVSKGSKKRGWGKHMRQWKGRTSPVNNECSAKLNPRKRKYSHPLFFLYPWSHRISVYIEKNTCPSEVTEAESSPEN